MQIHGAHSVHGVHALQGPHTARAPQPASRPTPAGTDQLDISEAAQLASQVHDLPDIRSDLVARVKGEIARGTYETPDKFHTAVDRLLDEMI